MIFSMDRTTVSGLNFDPSFFLHLKKGEQSLFFAPSIDRSGAAGLNETLLKEVVTLGPGANQEEAGLSPSVGYDMIHSRKKG